MSDAALTPELAALVERMVAERVDAAIDDRLGPLQAALDDLSRRLAAGEAAAAPRPAPGETAGAAR